MKNNRTIPVFFFLLILTVAAFCQPSNLTITACPSGCTYTTVQAAVTAVAALRASSCKTYVINVGVGTYGETDIPYTSDGCMQNIIVRSAVHYDLPRTRVTEAADAAKMPDLVAAANGWSLRYGSIAGKGAQWWVFDGIMTSTNPTLVTYANVYHEIDTGNNSVVVRSTDQLASHVQFIRNIARNPSYDTKTLGRSFYANGQDIRIERSWAFGAVGNEVQAVAYCEGANIEVVNNYLSAPGENIISGGCLIPSGQQKSFIGGFSMRNNSALGNLMEWQMYWKVTRGTGSLPIPCMAGEYYYHTNTLVWDLCNAGGGSVTTGVAAPKSNDLHNFPGEPGNVPQGLKVLGWDMKAGRGFRMAGNVLRNGWQNGQAGQCAMQNSSDEDNVYDFTMEYNNCSNTIQVWSAGISETWRPTIRHNIGWGIFPPNNNGGFASAFSGRLYETTDMKILNNSISTGNVSLVGGAWLAAGDNRPTDLVPKGGKGTVYIQNNIFGASGTIDNYALIGSSWGTPGSWCRLTEIVAGGASGWMLPGNALVYSNHAWGGQFANSPSLLTGNVCNFNGGISPIFPTGTIIGASSAAVFTSPYTGNLTPLVGLNAGTDGKNLGANIAGVNDMTQYSVSGNGNNPYLQAKFLGTFVTGSGAVRADFIPPIGVACTVQVSTVQSFSILLSPTITYTTTTTASITGLPAGVLWFRLNCGNLYWDLPNLVS